MSVLTHILVSCSSVVDVEEIIESTAHFDLSELVRNQGISFWHVCQDPLDATEPGEILDLQQRPDLPEGIGCWR